MIKNLIELGKNVDVIPFCERVETKNKMIDMRIELDENDNFIIESINIKEVQDKNIFYIKISNTINPGKTYHFFPTDFKLSNSLLKKGNKFDYEKINRNFSQTENFYENLDLESNIKDFLDNFYQFVLKDNSEFMRKVYNSKQKYINDITKTELKDILFVFSFSRQIIDEYNLKTKKEVEREYYNLGDIESLIDVFKKYVPHELAKKVNNSSKCIFCSSEDNLFSPTSASFYYSFVFEGKNSFYGLNDNNIEKQLVICKNCLANYFKGRKFVESYLNNNIIGIDYFALYDFNKLSISKSVIQDVFMENKTSDIFSSNQFTEKINELVERNRFLGNIGILGENENLEVELFFYIHDKNKKLRIIKSIRDIHPTRILNLLNQNNNIPYFNFNIYLINLFSSPSKKSNDNQTNNLLIKKRINIFEKILLEIPINYDSLTDRFIQKVVYDLRNQEKDEFKASNLTQNHIRFLELLSRLDCELYSNEIETFFEKEGVCIDMIEPEEKIEGESGLKKMENFISKNEFFSDTPEIRAGIPLGVTIARLSYNINNYEKRMLGYANKRINDMDSLKKYTNEIQEKAVMHGIANQPIVSSFFEKIGEILDKDNFSKDNFIFGIFIGYSLANKFTNPEKEGEKND